MKRLERGIEERRYGREDDVIRRLGGLILDIYNQQRADYPPSTTYRHTDG